MKRSHIHKKADLSASNPVFSQFQSRPLTTQAQSQSSKPLSQTETENREFQQHNFDAKRLKLQAKYGTITPERHEQLTVLQAKMSGLLHRRLEHASRFGRNFANIPISRPDAPSQQAFQRKLTIREPGDKYEQETDRVASQVVNQINAPVSQQAGQNFQREEMSIEEKELQMKPMLQLRLAKVGMTATADLETGIQQAWGGGQPLAANIRQPMEQAFGADFSKVKVHTDTQADQLNQSIQAKAFTTGQDIFFRQGEYNSESRGGQELLAHELTHVVQQNGSAVQCRIIQRAVDTIGGSWEAHKYQAVQEDVRSGAEIQLEFTPNELVDSKKIALLQKIEKRLNGRNLDRESVDNRNNNLLFGNAQRTAASRTQGDGHWDRDLRSTNPIYGAPNLEQGKSLSETPKSELRLPDSLYQLGDNHRSHKLQPQKFLRHQKQSAQLYDKPMMPDVGVGSRMIFETTAMSLEGEQKNVFYGSVRWGWSVNNVATPENLALTDIEIEPLAVVNMGTPSQEMTTLAKIWNQATTYTGDPNNPDENRNTPIPTTDHETTTLNSQDLQNPEAIRGVIDNLKLQLRGNPPENDKKNKQFELEYWQNKLKELIS